jgi:hypothetical protein
MNAPFGGHVFPDVVDELDAVIELKVTRLQPRRSRHQI